MRLPDNYIVALITFSLGIISASYGVQIGKSFEARKELLEKMRDWVDEIFLQLNALYLEEILNERKEIDSQGSRLVYGIHRVRWNGIVQGLRSSRLSVALNEFLAAIKAFDKRYYATEKTKEDHSKRKENLFLLLESVEDKAQALHNAITQESVQIPFWLVRPYWRLSLAVKRAIFIIIFIIILLVAGFYFKLL